MAIERTFAIIKPDAFANRHIGEIITRVESADFRVLGMRVEHLNETKAKGFYAVHAERPFFGSLIDFMTSGPVVLMVLEGENAVARWRELMGPTNPANAEKGTIRGDMAVNMEKNSAHGSDSLENAAIEIKYFFADSDLFPVDREKVLASGE